MPAERARQLARNVGRAARDHGGLRALARDAGVSHATVHRVVAGTVWADTHTVALLEEACGHALWPAYGTT